MSSRDRSTKLPVNKTELYVFDEESSSYKPLGDEVGIPVKIINSDMGLGGAGKSAYDIAVDNGFEGTVEEWLDSLKGDQGAQGEQGLRGEDGKDGKDGDSFTSREEIDEIKDTIDQILVKISELESTEWHWHHKVIMI